MMEIVKMIENGEGLKSAHAAKKFKQRRHLLPQQPGWNRAIFYYATQASFCGETRNKIQTDNRAILSE